MKHTVTHVQKRKALKLLYMRYRPEEIASETGIPLEEVEQACAAGCPHTVDADGTWIVGIDFQAWLGISINSSKKLPNQRGLINRENYREVKAFLDYRAKVLQFEARSIRSRWIELRHLLDWAGPARLADGKTIEPFFPTYLLTARNDGLDKELAPSMLRRICMGSRMFYLWAKQQYPQQYRDVPDAWIQAIRPAKSLMQPKIGEHQFWKLEDVLKIAKYPVSTLHDQRAQAAICFLYLSGMRISAFVTLPLNCVDIENRRVEQNPDKGVMTKNQKAAITTLLPIPQLIDVAAEWDAMVRSNLPACSPWFAYIDNSDRLKHPAREIRKQVNGRRMACVEGMQRLCALANVPYLSPHKLRHGHAIYGIKHARNMRELKAVSQNLMHSSIAITDGIYGNLNNEDLAQIIAGIGGNAEQLADEALIRRVLDILQNPPGLLSITN